jgi:alpha-tubulin suppressor-like RCC1 family protein
MNPRSPVSHVGSLVGFAMILATLGCSRTQLDEPSEPSSTDVAPNRPNGPQIAASRDRTCAVLRDGTVRCWGGDAAGDIDSSCNETGTDMLNGQEPICTKPELIPGISSAVGVTLGGEHSCVLLGDGTVWCWGTNTKGQLGDGSLIDHTTPTLVPSLADVRQIVAGENHTCALLGDSSVRCWGDNHHGQLGDGSTSERDSATIATIHGAVQIAASWDVTCARLADSTALCWGDNGNTGGPLGPWWRCTHFSVEGDTICPTPTAVPNVFGLVGITAFGFGTTGARTVLDWSDPSFDFDTPGLAKARTDFGEVAEMSGNWTGRKRCARDIDGSVRCQDAVIFAPWPTPTVIAGMGSAVSIAVGETHACLLAPDDSVACWGANPTGQLGDGTTQSHDEPVKVDM